MLKDSDKSVLPVPSGQVKKGSPPIPVKPKPANQVPRPGIPPPGEDDILVMIDDPSRESPSEQFEDLGTFCKSVHGLVAGSLT